MFGKKFVLASSFYLFSLTCVSAQNNSEEFYQNLLVSSELEQQSAEYEAKNSASKLLNRQIEVLSPNVSNDDENSIQTRNQFFQQISQQYGSAPFGLIWGESRKDAEKMGVRLIHVEVKDYPQAYEAQNPPMPLKDFPKLTLFFGDSDKLFRILAQSSFIQGDLPKGEKTMQLYDKYYKLLAQKYKNAQQFYTPAVQNVDESLPNDTQSLNAASQNPNDNPNLLAELQSGSADLYATFDGDNVGAALSVSVDGDGQSYITIDYRNLKILKENELNVLEAL